MEIIEAIKKLTSKKEFQELLQPLEQQTSWDSRRLYRYNGFWFPDYFIQAVLSCQNHFKSHDSDVILATMPKSGTTWLKALTFSIINRHIYTTDQSPLLTSNPHKLIPFLETDIYLTNQNPNLENIPAPRIFSSHMPFQFLPRSISESESRIIYICRNPLDQFVSHYHYITENIAQFEWKSLPIEEACDLFFQGIYPLGPFWDHILGYWNAHLENPQKILFLKYEDLKEDTLFHVKKIAQFIGLPFSLEEEKEGLVEQISSLCSFENLKNLEVNMTGKNGVMKNSSYFRKGEIGDWINYLTPEMAERFEKLMETKLQGSGLMFNASSKGV